MPSVTALRQALECGKTSCACHRTTGNTHCPAHDDGEPSMSITEGRTALLFKCFTGCETRDIIAALKARGLWDTEPQDRVVTPINRNDPDMLYKYVTADGEIVGEKGRWNGPPKTFKWRKPGERWGESSIPMDSMPLYNLHAVLDNPNAPVFLVEGEKAVEACRVRGMVAVCLPGGASQARFGNALDPLLHREVTLWPDNDDAGEGLMERIHGLLPDAKFLKPAVPEKGDAHDYFAQGGTIDGLAALMREGQPEVSVSRESVRVDIPHPAGAVAFTFTEMSWSTRAMDATLNVDVRVTGVPRTGYMTRLNIASASGRDGIRRELENVFGKKEIEWARLLSVACTEADRAWKSQDTSIDLYDVEPQPRKWFLDKRVPAEAVTIFFGMGGSTKSLDMLDMILHSMLDAVWLGIPMEAIRSALVIDFEDNPDEWRIRAESICKANGWEFPASRFRYLPGDAIPIAEQAQRIRALVKAHDIDVVLIDSASSASGGQLIDTVAVSRTVNFLQSLGVTVLMTAHNTKAEDSQYPYGSVNWHNLVRATHYVEAKQEEGSRTAYVTIWNRKGNRGRQKPIGLRIEFPETDDGPIRIQRDDMAIDLTASPESARSLRYRMWSWLSQAGRAATVREVADAMEVTEPIARKELNRYRGESFQNIGDAAKGLWVAVTKREDAAAWEA
jgi:hypothetical protein